MDLVVNEDFNEKRTKQDRDRFLFYRYYLEIEPIESVRRERYVESVGRLLERLWQSGGKAVAAVTSRANFQERAGTRPRRERGTETAMEPTEIPRRQNGR